MLEIKDLSTYYFLDKKEVKAVDNVSLKISAGEFLGLAGPSGCGKSTIGLSILRLIDPPGRIISGEILFEGYDLLKLQDPEMIKIRGKKISMIFQDPFTSLNPVITLGEQISEAIRYHLDLSKKEAEDRAIMLLGKVSISDAKKRFDEYPHQLSGGMRQRIMIAIAICCGAKLLIADEPTTALDVVTQGQIMRLLKEINEREGISVLLISHNSALINKYCQRKILMKDGKVIGTDK